MDARLKKLGMLFPLYIGFAPWIIIEVVFVSWRTASTMKEPIGQWGNGLSALGIGIALSISSKKGKVLTPGNILALLFLEFVAHTLYIDLDQLVTFIASDRFYGRGTATGLREELDRSSYLFNYLLSIIGGDSLFRIVYKSRLIAVDNNFLISMILATFIRIYLAVLRSGAVASALILLGLVASCFQENFSVTFSQGIQVADVSWRPMAPKIWYSLLQ